MNSTYNLVCAQKMGHSNNCCPLCPGERETNEHIFFAFNKAQCGWATTAIFYEDLPQQSTLVDAHSLIKILEDSLHKTPISTTRYFVHSLAHLSNPLKPVQ